MTQKYVLIILCAALFSFNAEAGLVKGYTKKDGTYVAPHYTNASHKKSKASKQRWVGKGSRSRHGATRK